MPIPKELRNTYIRSGEEKLRTLDRLWQKARMEGYTVAGLQTLKEFSHRLAGSGGSYGFHELGDAARSLELAILSAEDADTLKTAYRVLRKQLEELAMSPME